MRQAKAAVAEGRSILIYPEGTRTPVGSSLPYHAGTAALYRQLGVPVVPVALNSGVFWGRRKFIKWPGIIEVEVLPPIPPGLDRETFMATLRERIEGATAAAGGGRQAPVLGDRISFQFSVCSDIVFGRLWEWRSPWYCGGDSPSLVAVHPKT